MKYLNSIITGTGSYFPEKEIDNRDFIESKFYEKDGTIIDTDGADVIDKFEQITGINQRRYIKDELACSDIASKAAERAIMASGIDKESIDQIIVSHNFGNVIKDTIQTDILPSLASRVKHNLNIENPSCIPYDMLFGCPGWVQGLIQADAYIKAGIAKKCLVIGADTLSRVLDPHDRDSMIFADGAGAAIVEAVPSDEKKGILSTAVVSHTKEEAYYLYLGKSNKPDSDSKIRYIKMQGRKIYEYALSHVPQAMKTALDKSGVQINDLKKVIIHQANEKMDEAIIKRFFRLYKIRDVDPLIMPMNIHELGNSSVATVPTLYDMILKGKVKDQSIQSDDVIMFASVGAGMNINSIVYKQ